MDTTVLGDLAGESLGGRYLVDRALARGGMSTIYLATDTRLQRAVAVKVLRPDLSADPDFMARFAREARATAALSHPNVVSVFDFEVTERMAYLVLEYVPGHTLRHVINGHRLTPSQALAVTEPILEALIAAHDAGIVHRDIKPENVLIGPRSIVKVADFGLARALDDAEHRTRTGLVIGTAAYVSPEHIAGTGAGAASDIYSTGILLFEMLTGDPPFEGDNALSVAYQHMHSEVPRPSTRVAGLPTELDDLALGATARDPVDRFPSASAFLEEVRRVRTLMPPPDPLPSPIRDSPTAVLLASAGDKGSEVASGADDPAGGDLLADRDEATIGLLDADVSIGGAGEDPGTTEQEAVPLPPRRRRLRIALGSLLMVALVAGLTWSFLAGPLQRAPVPAIAGLSQADAEALLAESGMRLEVSDRQYSETAPRDTVISQDPEAESGAFIRMPVSAVISLGPERYAVPEVRGMSVEQAEAELTGTKLVVSGQAEDFDEEVPPGSVASTDPPTGTVVKPDTGITLVVSRGPAPRPVPDLLGKPQQAAVEALQELGLEAATTEDYSERYSAGTVAGTDPGVGTEVAKGSTVTLTISKGPPPVEVPRVVDLKRQDAINRLRAAGFDVKVQEGVVTPLDRVYSQDPPPGEMRPKGSTVSISIF